MRHSKKVETLLFCGFLRGKKGKIGILNGFHIHSMTQKKIEIKKNQLIKSEPGLENNKILSTLFKIRQQFILIISKAFSSAKQLHAHDL